MNNIDFAPLKAESDDFWFWYNEIGNTGSDMDDGENFNEISLSKEAEDRYILEYNDQNMSIYVYEGNIPSRKFFELLLQNCRRIKELKLLNNYEP